MLPNPLNLSAEQGISSSTRAAIAAAVAGIHACRSDTVALKTAGAAIVSGSVVIAAVCRTWEPILGLVVLIVLPILGKSLKRRRILTLKERTLAARAKADFSNGQYMELVTSLAWDPISKSEKERLLT